MSLGLGPLSLLLYAAAAGSPAPAPEQPVEPPPEEAPEVEAPEATPETTPVPPPPVGEPETTSSVVIEPAEPTPGTSEPVEDVLRRARNEYAYGNYGPAVELYRALLYPMRLYSDEQVIEARRYLGLSHYLLGQVDEASNEFAKLLYLDPDYELDPFTVAPPVIELFESVRKKHQVHLDALRESKTAKQLEDAPGRGVRRTVIVDTELRSDLATFMPFGIGQFQNGDVGAGIAFAVVQAVFLGLNIASFAWLRAQEVDGRPAYRTSEADLVQAMTITQFASAAALGVVWSIGIFHARLNFVPSVQRRTVTDEPVVRGAGASLRFDLTF